MLKNMLILFNFQFPFDTPFFSRSVWFRSVPIVPIADQENPKSSLEVMVDSTCAC